MQFILEKYRKEVNVKKDLEWSVW